MPGESIDKDTERLRWFNPGLLPDEEIAVFKTATAPIVAAQTSIDNLDQFFLAWKAYFAEYARALAARKIDTNALVKQSEFCEGGVSSFIDINKQKVRALESERGAAEILTALALFRAQVIPNWIYSVYCEIYSAIEKATVRTDTLKQKYRNICTLVEELKLEGDLFPRIPSVTTRPAPIDIDADAARIKMALGASTSSTQSHILPTIMPVASSVFSKTTARVNFLQDHWHAIFAIVLVCIGMIVVVMFVIKMQPRATTSKRAAKK